MKNPTRANGRNDDGDRADESTYQEKIEVLLHKHVKYFDHMAWPEKGTEAWGDMVATWVEAFGFRHVSPRRLEKAMREIRQNPPQWKQDHLPRLLELVEGYKRDEQSAADAAALSHGEHDGPCPYCEGNGYALIYRRDYKGEEVKHAVNVDESRGRMIYLRICAPCICHQGRAAFGDLVRSKTRCVDIAVMPRDWSFEEPGWHPSAMGGAVA